MNFLLKVLLTAVAVFVLAAILPGVEIANYVTAVWVAFAIAVLNMFVRPLLIFFTLPATIVTLGLFLFVINALIILLAAHLVGGFLVSSFFSALLFSVLLSIFRSTLFKLIKDKKKEELKPEKEEFKAKNITIYTTTENTNLKISLTDKKVFTDMKQPLETEIAILVNPKKQFQSFLGIGGAITDASAEVFALSLIHI